MINKEFWNELVTKESWEKLIALSKKYNFIVIGGWAAYLWTKTHKSKDIDIIVDYAELGAIRSDFTLEKNERLHKYEVKFQNFDLDIYVPKFSQLAIPVENLKKYKTRVEGIPVVSSEALLVLKQAAEINRLGSIKGKKDQIDILTILLYAPVDIAKYKEILKQYKVEKRIPTKN